MLIREKKWSDKTILSKIDDIIQNGFWSEKTKLIIIKNLLKK